MFAPLLVSQVSEYYLTPLSGGNEPIPDAILVNGEMTKQLGIRASRRQPMRLRFIAANAFSMWTISVDGCALQVVEVDGTAVEPYDVSGAASSSTRVLNVSSLVYIYTYAYICIRTCTRVSSSSFTANC